VGLAVRVVSLLVAALVWAQPASAQSLPDWTGVWELVGGTLFDRTTADPPDGRSGDPGVRQRPPYNAEWEARYQANMVRVAEDRFPDPVSTCGTPAGFPRLLNIVDGYEFVVTPKQTWILTENGPNVARIYTDGRGHLAEEDIWPTYTGDSVGHWEGDTLVFTTIGLKGENGTIVDRTGAVLSEQMRVATRLRKREDGMMEAVITIEGDVRIMDYACAENNRNPVDPVTGRTLTLGPDGKPIDADYSGE
jgi:hypothetical protein